MNIRYPIYEGVYRILTLHVSDYESKKGNIRKIGFHKTP